MNKEKKEIIDSLKINSKDVGSSEVQIGLLSGKINGLANHFKKNKRDKHSTRGLVKAVNILTEFSPSIRKALSKKVNMKFLPKVSFVSDKSFDYAEKIERLIEKNR